MTVRLIRLATLLMGVCALLIAAAYMVGRGISLGAGHWLKLGDRYPSEIYLVDSSRQVYANLTKTPANETYMAWSLDEQFLAFISNRDGSDDIYITNIWNGGTRNLTNNNLRNSSPSWSPDGRQIAFYMTFPDSDDLYVVDASGGNQHRLVQSVVPYYSPPCWSSAGSYIAFDFRTVTTDETYLVNVASMELQPFAGANIAPETIACLN
jgi:Tol biopolymer transport system component